MRNRNTLKEEIDFYFDKNGLLAFTEKYLLERGFCCGNGCRHCPYNYENVIDPVKKMALQNQRKENDRKEEKPF